MFDSILASVIGTIVAVALNEIISAYKNNRHESDDDC